jgi:hypothetical protein
MGSEDYCLGMALEFMVFCLKLIIFLKEHFTKISMKLKTISKMFLREWA